LVKVLATNLSGKQVFTDRGNVIGKLVDLNIKLKSGKVESIVVRAEDDTKVSVPLERDKDGLFVVPYDAVIAVKEGVVVSEDRLFERTSI